MAIIRLRLLTGVCLGQANGGDKPAGEIVELDANEGMAMSFMNQAESLPLDIPIINSITPSSVVMGSPDVTVHIRGGKFYEHDSQILWNGQPVETNARKRRRAVYHIFCVFDFVIVDPSWEKQSG